MYEFKECLSKSKKAKETAVLNLRTRWGMNFKQFEQITGLNILELKKTELDKLKFEKFISFKKKNGLIYGLKLTKKGFLFYNYVASCLI